MSCVMSVRILFKEYDEDGCSGCSSDLVSDLEIGKKTSWSLERNE